MKNCAFCSSHVKDITFLESTHFRCFYNQSPILPGHTLVTSKKHIQSMLDLNDVQRCELMRLSARTIEPLLELFNADAFNWTIQDQPPAGQTVPHFHLHLIPRIEGDLPDPGDWYPLLEEQYEEPKGSDERPTLSENQLETITLKIKKHIHQHNQRRFVK